MSIASRHGPLTDATFVIAGARDQCVVDRIPIVSAGESPVKDLIVVGALLLDMSDEEIDLGRQSLPNDGRLSEPRKGGVCAMGDSFVAK